METLRARLSRPVDPASLVFFRVVFGLVMAVSAVRFMANGWVERFFVERTFTFKYWGFGWVEPGPAWAMYGVYALLALLGLCIAAGLFYRVAIALFFVLFSYAELTDVTNYLNHYYLVSLVALLMAFMPLSRAGSLDVWRRPEARVLAFPAWMLYLLRFQIATVYFGAALAKVGSDWLVHGQPLNVWLSSLVDLPVIGPYLVYPEVALCASWAGFLHDLLIVPLLAVRRTRAVAYAFLLSFHLMTSTWFNIGIFPVLMPLGATLFFDPAWPRRFLSKRANVVGHEDAPRTPLLPRWGMGLVAAYCALQVLAPFRTHLYGGNVLWHEQGMRFSWRVMLRAKQGSITYRARLPDGRELRISPRRYLSSDQEREMSGQPDLILQLAHHIADDLRARGVVRPEVRVDALVSLNGRRPVPMIDPDVDLAQVDDGFAKADWITAPPREPPGHVQPREHYARMEP